MNSFLVKSADYFEKKFPCEWKPSTTTTAEAMTSQSSGRIISKTKSTKTKRTTEHTNAHIYACKKKRSALETCLF